MPAINAKKTVAGGYDPRKRAPRMKVTNDLYVDELKKMTDEAEAMLAKEKGMKFWKTGGRDKRPPTPEEKYLVWLTASTSEAKAQRRKCEPVVQGGKHMEYGDLRLYVQPASEAFKTRNAPAQEATEQFQETWDGRDGRFTVSDAEGNRHGPTPVED